jgi:3-deoxy-manno-octulosonate cytidylyltransferase (CMP-KDO synthetase)
MAVKVSCVIPARLAASRFPDKLLQSLAGTPVIVRTLRCAEAAGCFDEIVCLTDSEQIQALVLEAGFRAALSGPAANGTDRIANNLQSITYDLIVNLQGDEPVFPREGLIQICKSLQAKPTAVHVLVHDRELTRVELSNPNRCKAGLSSQGQVLDFYRVGPHPFSGMLQSLARSRLQMGVYGYCKDFLRQYAKLPVSPLEKEESHELLRDINLAPIWAEACEKSSQAIDVPQDMDAAYALLTRRS